MVHFYVGKKLCCGNYNTEASMCWNCVCMCNHGERGRGKKGDRESLIPVNQPHDLDLRMFSTGPFPVLLP